MELWAPTYNWFSGAHLAGKFATGSFGPLVPIGRSISAKPLETREVKVESFDCSTCIRQTNLQHRRLPEQCRHNLGCWNHSGCTSCTWNTILGNPSWNSQATSIGMARGERKFEYPTTAKNMFGTLALNHGSICL